MSSLESEPNDLGQPIGLQVPEKEGSGPERRVYTGRYAVLEPPMPEKHAEGLYGRSHGDPETEALWTYMPYGPFPDSAAFADWMTSCAASSDPHWLTVLRAEDRAPVGMVSYLNIVPDMRSIELGHIWYSPEVQRSKVTTETMFLMLVHSFEELACRRVEWKCNALNARSRAAARRLGFSFEGVFRQHLITKGRNRDTAWYGLLDRDWPTIKPNFERWLYGAEDVGSLSALNAAVLRPGPVDDV